MKRIADSRYREISQLGPRACVLSDDEIVEIDKASIEVLPEIRVIAKGVAAALRALKSIMRRRLQRFRKT